MRKLMKKLTSGILAAAMVTSLLAGAPKVTVEAEELYELINGGFETGDMTGWTVDETATTVSEEDTKEITTNEWASDKTNHFLNVWSKGGGSYVISQTITLPAGTYKFGVKNAGDAGDSSSEISYKIGDGDVITKKLAAMTSWDTWNETTTKNFTVTETASVTCFVSVKLDAGKYEKIDDIVLYVDVEDNDSEEIKALKSLIAIAKKYITDSCTSDSVANYNEKLTAAESIITDSDTATEDEIQTAYNNLVTAIEGLQKDVERVSDYVSKIKYGDSDDVIITPIENANLTEDTIRGIDVSSYISLMDAFDYLNEQAKSNGKEANYGFKDTEGNLLTRQGFFNYLASQGVNYIRVRVWNDPYNSVMTDKGYGGGDNDVDKAIEIGKYATNAGMKLLVDFHFSDFWTDPGKQRAPKAWTEFTVDEKATAIADFTKETLNAMKDNNIDVGMVQIGNETNGKFCGETSWTNMNILFDAGCDAVHEVDANIKAVLHFTDVQTSGKQTGYAASLAGYDGDGDEEKEGVSYDVFATSYYPYWHGSLTNLTSVLNTIATTYDKEVMVAETSYANTMIDTDGHTNTVRVGTNDTGDDLLWDMNVQGQASEVRAVIDAVLNVENNKGLGVFYWEGAWITLQNTNVEDEDAYKTLVQSNRELWEKYGAGWSSAAASEYGTDEAQFYGGSAVDNQAFFDAEGRPLPSIKAFNYEYLKEGYGDTELTVTGYNDLTYTLEVGNSLKSSDLPKGLAIYSNAEKKEFDIDWDSNDIELINSKATSDANVGDYTVKGSATVNGETVEQICKVTLAPQNHLSNGDFEENGTNTWKDWTSTGIGCNTKDMDTNSRSGSGSVHYYNADEFKFSVNQSVDVSDLTSFIPGIYDAYVYFEGADSSVKVVVTAGSDVYKSDAVTSGGWGTWLKVDVNNIDLSYDKIKDIEDGKITYKIECTGSAGAYGGIDDAHLCLEQVDPVYAQALEDAGKVDEMISSIGVITAETEDNIEAARASYNALTSLAKKFVTMYDDLCAAEVDLNIVKIGEVTLESEAEITAVRTAYDALSDEAKNKVTKLSELNAAELELQKLIAEKAEADKTAQVQPVPAQNGSEIASTDEKEYATYTVISEDSKKPEVEYGGTGSDKSKTVVISDTVTDANGVTYTVTKIADNALKDNKNVTTVIIGKNITEIGANAFNNCTKLKKVTVKSSSITKIGAGAFKGDKALTSVDLSKSVVKTIGKNAFSGCKKLKTIKLNGNKLTNVSKGAFKNIKKNATITINAKNKKTYKKVVKLIKKSGAKNVKFKFKKK